MSLVSLVGRSECLNQRQKTVDHVCAQSMRRARCVFFVDLCLVAAAEEVKHVFVLGDTFLVGRAVVFDVENVQVHLACLEDEGCESEVPLNWLQRLWRSWSAIIVVVGIGAVRGVAAGYVPEPPVACVVCLTQSLVRLGGE